MDIKFVNSVKKKYIERLINREKEWPPRQSNKLVRLQLVHHNIAVKKKGGCHANNIMPRGRDDNTAKRFPLAYSDIFKRESEKGTVRKVLVEGDAGIGKSTLTISICEDWAHEKLFQQFELLLLLQLRHKKIASARSLPELLKFFHSSPSVCESVARYLEEEEAENVLIIADGWDELGESEEIEDSFLYELLFDKFPLMSVIVTSRPSACASLHSLPCIDRFVEISGFNKDDIKEYVHSEFPSDEKIALRLLDQLEYNPLIESVCSIPLNCAIVCYLWHFDEEVLPSTTTQLYTKLIQRVVCRNLRKLKAYGPTFAMTSFDSLPEGLQQSWWQLCEFACTALRTDQIVFTKERVHRFFPGGSSLDEILSFGLLHITETVLDLDCVVSFNFLHLTFMEYLAALHLSKRAKCFPFANSDMVFRFFFGLFLERVPKQKIKSIVKQAILHTIISSYEERELRLCHCAFEAQKDFVNNEVIEYLLNHADWDGYTTVGYPHNAYDCTALLYVLDNMPECTGLKINFNCSDIREDQLKRLTEVLANKHGKVEVCDLSLHSNTLSSQCFSDLFHKASAAFRSLTSLFLAGNRIGNQITAANTATQTMASSSRLALLQALENTVRNGYLSQLRSLYLTGSLTNDPDTNASWLTTFVEAIFAHCPNLMELGLSRNNIGVPGATALAKIIPRLQKLIDAVTYSPNDIDNNFLLKTRPYRFVGDIQLSQANLGDKGLCSFIDQLEDVCHFDSLGLSGNDIHATGLSCLTDAICSGKILRKGYFSCLNLSDNPIGTHARNCSSL